MKNLLIALFALGILLNFNSCKKEDEAPEVPKSALENWTSNITVPSAMLQSSDPYAQQAYGYITQAQSVSQWLSSLQPPAGAKVVGKTGSINTLYEWTDIGSGWIIRMNIYSNTTHQYWEVSFNDGTGWFDYYKAEEKLDGSEGYLKVYDDYYYGAGSGQIMYRYDWVISTNKLQLTLDYPFDDFFMDLTVNLDGSGFVDYYYDGTIEYNMTWDSQGNGSWTEYDSFGNVIDSGTWTV